ncbi:MAG: HYR domain-containing protein [Proteobacteria bacterium]|nr:HYR domain-containing protein [Pseudomonadota bacterium]
MMTAVTTSCSGSDICDPQVQTDSTASTEYALGNHSFDCTATDVSGNADSVNCQVEIVDTTQPAIGCTGDTVECSGVMTAVTTSCDATDVCDGLLEPTSTATSEYTLGSHSFNCSAIDVSGNTNSTNCAVVIEDTTPPEPGCTGDSKEATGPLTPVSTTCEATDVCEGTSPATSDAASEYAVGLHVFTCSAFDGSGNTAETTCQVEITDTTPPVVTVPADITVEATSEAGADVSFTSSATDIVDGTLPTSCDLASPSTFPLGSTDVTCTAMDEAGNLGSASFAVKVVDTTPPTTTITLEDPDSDAQVDSFTLDATDIATSIAAIEYRFDGGSLALYAGGSVAIPAGTTSIGFFATDGAGNVETEQTVEVATDRCPGVRGFAAPEYYVLEILDFESTSSNPDVALVPRVFTGNTEVEADGDGKYHIPLFDDNGDPIVDDTDFDALPKGVWVVDRADGEINAGNWGKFGGGGYVWFHTRATLEGAVHVKNQRRRRFERYRDGTATKGSYFQDELTVTTGDTSTEIVAQSSVRYSADMYEVQFADLEGCPFGDLTYVDVRIIDLKRSGVCGTYANGWKKISCTVPAEGVPVRIFDREDGDFVAIFGKRPRHHLYDDIFEAGIGQVGECVTGPDGSCLAPEDHPGKFLVISKLYDTDEDLNIYQGRHKNFRGRVIRDFEEEESDDEDPLESTPLKERVKHKHLRYMKLVKHNGSVKYSSCGRNIVIGSEITIDAVDYTIWTDTEELYPFVFESEEDWTIDVCMQVPEGYDVAGILDEDGNVVETDDCIQTLVTDEQRVFLFRVIDLQSPEPNLSLAMDVQRHGGDLTRIERKVEGMRAWKEAEVEAEVDAKVARILARRRANAGIEEVPLNEQPRAIPVLHFPTETESAQVAVASVVGTILAKPKRVAAARESIDDHGLADNTKREVAEPTVLEGDENGFGFAYGGLLLLFVGLSIVFWRRRSS